MLFINFVKNKTKQNITIIAKIALVILLLALISDKQHIFNFSQEINRVQSLNLELLINDLLSITRLAMINFSLFEAIGLGCVVFVFVSTMSYAIVAIIEEKVKEEKKNYYSFKVESSTHFRTNNIYLLTNKFIC